MSHLSRRSITQILILCGIAAFVMLTGWACDCGSGSDHYAQDYSSPDAILPGQLDRYHDFQQTAFTVTEKDLEALNNFLENGGAGFGVLLPQADGATQPGVLAEGSSPNLFLYSYDGIDPFYLSVPLTTSQAMAAQLTELMPPPAGTRWQALEIVPGDWMTQVPTQTTTFDMMNGSLYYRVDFMTEEDVCNHCEVKLTTCSNQPLTAPQKLLLATLGQGLYVSSEDITCAQPVSTYVMLSNDMGEPVPGPVVASFGMFGGVAYTSTMQSDFVIPYSLQQTSLLTQTMSLSPVRSEQGWEYTWADLAGNPITEIDLPPFEDYWSGFFNPNLQLVASGVPTCVTMQDTLYLTATMVATPTIQALATTLLDVLPDPDTCDVADLGVSQVASTEVVTAGNWVTYTFVITNFEAPARDAEVTQTLSPASALTNARLPSGCTRSLGEIVCQLNDIPAFGTVTLVIAIQTSESFSGVMDSMAEVQPLGLADLRYYDNSTPWLGVTVISSEPPPPDYFFTFLPCTQKH